MLVRLPAQKASKLKIDRCYCQLAYAKRIPDQIIWLFRSLLTLSFTTALATGYRVHGPGGIHEMLPTGGQKSALTAAEPADPSAPRWDFFRTFVVPFHHANGGCARSSSNSYPGQGTVSNHPVALSGSKCTDGVPTVSNFHRQVNSKPAVMLTGARCRVRPEQVNIFLQKHGRKR